MKNEEKIKTEQWCFVYRYNIHKCTVVVKESRKNIKPIDPCTAHSTHHVSHSHILAFHWARIYDKSEKPVKWSIYTLGKEIIKNAECYFGVRWLTQTSHIEVLNKTDLTIHFAHSLDYWLIFGFFQYIKLFIVWSVWCGESNTFFFLHSISFHLSHTNQMMCGFVVLFCFASKYPSMKILTLIQCTQWLRDDINNSVKGHLI